MTAIDLGIPALRAAIIGGEDQAPDLVRLALETAGEAGQRIELLVLLAESYQRLGHVTDARFALTTAVNTAAGAGLPSTDRRQAALVAVSADLAVWDGHAEAVQACTLYAEHARDVERDLLRFAIAAALRAVAIYHRESCQQGKQLLETLLGRTVGDHDPMGELDTLGTMARLGVAAMQDGCRTFCQPPLKVVPPIPGGILHDGLTELPPDYLSSRIRRHPAAHTCEWAIRQAGSSRREA